MSETPESKTEEPLVVAEGADALTTDPDAQVASQQDQAESASERETSESAADSEAEPVQDSVDEAEAAVKDPSQPEQSEMPFAVVQGEKIFELPKDLYIPPDALEVFLEAFEGPLDMLLYLIRRQNLDILDIPIAEITLQYVKYVEVMQEFRLELAGEYLVMAAMLMEIKSRMLLPRPEGVEDGEELDPRAELVRRLQEYERYKQAAEDIEDLPRQERDTWQGHAQVSDKQVVRLQPDVDLREMLSAFADVMKRTELFTSHQIEKEPLSVRERMSQVLERLGGDNFTIFADLFDPEEGRSGVVVTFLAILELVKASLIELAQAEPYAPVHVRAATSQIDIDNET